MHTITADASMKTLLNQVNDVAEIRDADGNVMGIYTPSERNEKELYEKAKLLFNPLEIERRKREEGNKGSPLADVWARIRAAESNP